MAIYFQPIEFVSIHTNSFVSFVLGLGNHKTNLCIHQSYSAAWGPGTLAGVFVWEAPAKAPGDHLCYQPKVFGCKSSKWEKKGLGRDRERIPEVGNYTASWSHTVAQRKEDTAEYLPEKASRYCQVSHKISLTSCEVMKILRVLMIL